MGMWDSLTQTAGSIWDETLQFGSEAAESVSEGAGAYLNKWIGSEVGKMEASADPATAAKKEPVKGKDANGETLVVKRRDGQISLSTRDLATYGAIGFGVVALLFALGSR